MAKGTVSVADIRKEVGKNEAHHVNILREGLKASFLSRDDFQKWFAAELKRIGVEVEIFEVDPSELLEQPSQRKTLRENPSALNRGEAGCPCPDGCGGNGHIDEPETPLFIRNLSSLVISGDKSDFRTRDGCTARIHHGPVNLKTLVLRADRVGWDQGADCDQKQDAIQDCSPAGLEGCVPSEPQKVHPIHMNGGGTHLNPLLSASHITSPAGE